MSKYYITESRNSYDYNILTEKPVYIESDELELDDNFVKEYKNLQNKYHKIWKELDNMLALKNMLLLSDENGNIVEFCIDDCKRIISIGKKNGYSISLNKAYNLWSRYSDNYAASWTTMPKNDDDLWDIICDLGEYI